MKFGHSASHAEGSFTPNEESDEALLPSSDLFAEYIAAVDGFLTLRSQDGFLTYREQDDGSFYIRDIYTRPGARKKGQAKKLADLVVAMAKSKGARVVYGSVRENLPNATRSIAVLIAYGMTFQGFDRARGILIFEKRLDQ